MEIKTPASADAPSFLKRAGASWFVILYKAETSRFVPSLENEGNVCNADMGCFDQAHRGSQFVILYKAEASRFVPSLEKRVARSDGCFDPNRVF